MLHIMQMSFILSVYFDISVRLLTLFPSQGKRYPLKITMLSVQVCLPPISTRWPIFTKFGMNVMRLEIIPKSISDSLQSLITICPRSELLRWKRHYLHLLQDPEMTADYGKRCRIWGFHSGGYEEYHLLWYDLIASWFLAEPISSTLKMEAICSSKTVGWHSPDYTASYPRRWYSLW
jgi:hypothetical protein